MVDASSFVLGAVAGLLVAAGAAAAAMAWRRLVGDERGGAPPDGGAAVTETLRRLEEHLRELERSRQYSYGELTAQVRELARGQLLLRDETGRLATALRSPGARGRWGELQLRRVVELAGMSDRCDFVEQPVVGGAGERRRPDLVVNLPGERQVVVDAKVPLDAYLAAAEADSEEERQRALARHAQALRAQVTALAARSYGEQFATPPELVVLFLPGESFLAAALDHDPGLLERAAELGVVLATPTTLIALLRAVAHGWRQDTAATSAREVCELGRELHRRLATMSEHVAALGASLDRAVRSYNDTVGSLESRVLVSARRLAELGAGVGELPAPTPVDRAPRSVRAAG